jgi:hypothetical protein
LDASEKKDMAHDWLHPYEQEVEIEHLGRSNIQKSNDITKLKDEKLLEAFEKDLCDIIDNAKNDTISIDKRYERFCYS